MAPKSQRSRACAQCRSRRVKCDETPDLCNQCRRLGLNCSGPVVGSIVIDMTERIVKPRGREKKAVTRASIAIRERGDEGSLAKLDPARAEPEPQNKTSALDMPVPNPMFPTERRYTQDVEKAITAVRYHHRQPTFYQPSRVLPEALDLAFLSHYVELNKGTRTYAPEVQWLVHLPRIHSSANKPAVRLCLRAVSMAFYGKLQQDPGILVDSWRWYTRSLSAQRLSISKLKGDAIPDEEEVLVPLILSLYELYVGASSSGSMTHLSAATQIMNMRGPRNCRSGAVWPLFKGIRNSDAHKALVFNNPSVYSSPDWMTLPFIGMPRDAHQRLADIELMVPHCMALLHIQGSLRVFFETPIPSYVDVGPCRGLTSKLLSDLDRWATTYPHLTKPIRSIPSSSASDVGLDSTDEEAKRSTLPDTFISLIGSNYVAVRLTLSMLMYKIETRTKTPPSSRGTSHTDFFDEAIQCAEVILKGAADVERAQTPGFDLLRSVTPVVIVLCTAPTPELKDSARETIKRWGAKVGGLGSLLLSL